jgi:hypothetical protein
MNLKKFIAGFFGFVLGAAIGYCVVLFGWVAYTNLVDYRDFEGAATMGVAFFLAPIGAIIVGIAGAIWLARCVAH